MENVFARSTPLEIFFSGVGQTKGVIKFSACQQSSVRSDDRALKIQTNFRVKVELERGLFIVTHEVPPTRLRNQKLNLPGLSEGVFNLGVRGMLGGEVRE